MPDEERPTDCLQPEFWGSCEQKEIGRIVGGDDGALGPPQSISAYDYYTTVSWVGTTLIISNSSLTGGYTWIMQTPVPVPAAVWLFGGALVGMIWLKRRQPAA